MCDMRSPEISESGRTDPGNALLHALSIGSLVSQPYAFTLPSDADRRLDRVADVVDLAGTHGDDRRALRHGIRNVASASLDQS